MPKQLDRFLFNVLIDYPNFADEANMVKTVLGGHVGRPSILTVLLVMYRPTHQTTKYDRQSRMDDRIMNTPYKLSVSRESPIQSGAGPRGGIAICEHPELRLNAGGDTSSLTMW